MCRQDPGCRHGRRSGSRSALRHRATARRNRSSSSSTASRRRTVLAEHNETVLKRTLEQLQSATLRQRVRACLEVQLPDGEPSAERIAQTLHLSLRSLQRHLADEGCTYESLLADTRHSL